MSVRKISKVKNRTLLFIMIAFLIAIIGGTYSRYSSQGTASGKGEVAKWHIELNDTDISLANTSVNVTAETISGVSSENITSGKMAPGQTLGANFSVDPTGSEVAIDYELEIGAITGENFDTDSTISISKVTAMVYGESPVEMVVSNGKYLFFESLDDVLANKNVTFTAYINWDVNSNNAADTLNGTSVLNLQVPINVTAKQHIGLVTNVSTTTDVNNLINAVSSINRGGTVTLTDNMDLSSYENSDYGTPLNVVNFPEDATYDLNGQTVETRNFAVAYQGNDLTIKNGTFVALPRFASQDATSTYGSYALFLWDNDNVSNNITIKNITSTGGINAKNAQNIVLEDCNVTATAYYAVYGNVNTSITINSGTYTSGGQTLFGFNSFDKENPGVTNQADGFKIYGGTFYTKGNGLCLTGSNSSEGWYAPVIYGGTFDCDVTSYVADGYRCIESGNGIYVVEKIQ